MRILHVHDVANVGSTMVEGLRALGHDAELRRVRLAAARRSTLVKLLALPARLVEFAAVNRQVHRGHYDVVHIHFAYLGWLGILGGYPYFLHCHGSDVRRGLRDPLRRGPVRQALRRARTVFFVTPDLADIVRAVRPDALFLPDPIRVDRFRPPERAAAGPPRVLIISALSPLKGVDVAFAAVRRLLDLHPEVPVTALDLGPLRDRYHGVPGVTLIPPVPYAEMPALIQSHDIVVGQFRLGILSMSELESMACGRPVVCSFRYGDWYGEPPPVLSTDQAEQAAAHLAALVERPELRRDHGERGRQWVERYHGYMSIARRLEQVYQEAV